MPTLSQNIDLLYQQISSFENADKAFSTDAFTQNMNGVLSAFELLRNQPELGAQADESLYGHIREVDPDTSTLRFMASHILGMYLEAWAHGPSGYRRSYQDLLRFRPDEARTDSDFIEQLLVPRLLELRPLAGNADIGFYLMLQLASYLQTFAGPPSLPPRPSRLDLERLPPHQLLLGFGRRRIAFPGKNLVESADAWEYGMKREGYFKRLAETMKKQRIDMEPYLLRLGLLEKTPWWKRLLAAIGRFFGGIGANMKATADKLPAGGVVFSVFVILIVLLAAIAVPIFWFEHYDKRVRHFNEAAGDVASRPMDTPK